MARSSKKADSGPSALPPDINAALAEAICAVKPDSERAKRLHRHIMAHIGGLPGSRGYVTVHWEQGQWISVDSHVSMKMLYRDSQTASFLLHLQPGASLPAHVHGADEECLVLEGELSLGEGTVLSAGDYHMAPQHQRHGLATSDKGALLFLRSAQPAYALPESPDSV